MGRLFMLRMIETCATKMHYRISKYRIQDNFWMDFENACLSQHWDNSIREHPKGVKRHLDPGWAAMMKSQLEYGAAGTWKQYVRWVELGNGDEWFQESETDSEEE